MLLLFFNGTVGTFFLWYGPDPLRTMRVEDEERRVVVT